MPAAQAAAAVPYLESAAEAGHDAVAQLAARGEAPPSAAQAQREYDAEMELLRSQSATRLQTVERGRAARRAAQLRREVAESEGRARRAAAVRVQSAARRKAASEKVRATRAAAGGSPTPSAG